MGDLGGFDAHWVWLALGLTLAALEMVVPGVYLIWLAVAAIITGVLTYGLDLSIGWQVIQFVSLSLIAAFSAKRFLRDRPIVSSDPLMNQKGGRLVGQMASVTTAIEGGMGMGRVHLGDSDWSARSDGDIAVGTRVRVTGTDGTTLLVEPVTVDTGNAIADQSAASPEASS